MARVAELERIVGPAFELHEGPSASGKGGSTSGGGFVGGSDESGGGDDDGGGDMAVRR